MRGGYSGSEASADSPSSTILKRWTKSERTAIRLPPNVAGPAGDCASAVHIVSPVTIRRVTFPSILIANPRLEAR